MIGATLDAGASPDVLAAASAGVVVRPEGTAVAVGAIASLRRADAGRGVGGGILLDSKNRTGDAGSGAAAGPAASAPGEASGVAAARGEEAASGDDAARGAEAIAESGAAKDEGATAGGVDTASPDELGTSRLRPHDWQLVCPRKTSVAPQNRHVGFCDPCPNVTLYLTTAGHRAAAPLPASMTAENRERIGRSALIAPPGVNATPSAAARASDQTAGPPPPAPN
jgi:hypothetical protein